MRLEAGELVKRIAVGVSMVLGLVGVLWLALNLAAALYRQPQTLGGLETVRLIGPAREIEIVAKIDTGADISSIDEQLALSLGYTPSSRERKRIITERGVEERDTLTITYLMSGRQISSTVTVADRSGLSTPMLVGKSDLPGFVIDPAREFLTQPREKAPFQFLSPADMLTSARLAQVIIMVPILATVVVLLRLFVGVRTHGVFAPTIIALTLLGPNILSGVVFYVLLVVVGMAAKTLLLDRLRLAHLSELALIMCLLVMLVAGLRAAAGGFISFGAAFFPLIVTTHLIEQASRSVEEHGLREASLQLGSTIGIALVLAAIGQFLIEQSVTILWMAFAASVVASIGAGIYSGLRLSEVVRFKFLRRTHVHR